MNDFYSQNNGKYWIKILWRKFPNVWTETGKSFSDAEPAISLQKQKYTLLGGNGNITEIYPHVNPAVSVFPWFNFREQVILCRSDLAIAESVLGPFR